MPTVYVKFKSSTSSSGAVSWQTVNVSKKPPTESEVLAQLQKLYPKKDIVLLEIK